MLPGRMWADALQNAKAYAIYPEQDEDLLIRLCWIGAICVAGGSDPEELDEDGKGKDALLITAALIYIPRRTHATKIPNQSRSKSKGRKAIPASFDP